MFELKLKTYNVFVQTLHDMGLFCEPVETRGSNPISSRITNFGNALGRKYVEMCGTFTKVLVLVFWYKWPPATGLLA